MKKMRQNDLIVSGGASCAHRWIHKCDACTCRGAHVWVLIFILTCAYVCKWAAFMLTIFYMLVYVILCMWVHTGELVYGMHMKTCAWVCGICLYLAITKGVLKFLVVLVSGSVKGIAVFPLAFKAICQLLHSLFLPTSESFLCLAPLSPSRAKPRKG